MSVSSLEVCFPFKARIYQSNQSISSGQPSETGGKISRFPKGPMIMSISNGVIQEFNKDQGTENAASQQVAIVVGGHSEPARQYMSIPPFLNRIVVMFGFFCIHWMVSATLVVEFPHVAQRSKNASAGARCEGLRFKVHFDACIGLYIVK